MRDNVIINDPNLGDMVIQVIVCDVCKKEEPFSAGRRWIHLEAVIPDADLNLATPVYPIINRIDLCSFTCLHTYCSSATPNS